MADKLVMSIVFETCWNVATFHTVLDNENLRMVSLFVKLIELLYQQLESDSQIFFYSVFWMLLMINIISMPTREED